MHSHIIETYSAPVPRYTSYPTAPHFHNRIGPQTYAGWLRALPEGASLSLYLHIPFCDRLCWFCGCNTKQVRRYEPIMAYLNALIAEIALVGRTVGAGKTVTAVHFGGGSPTMLMPHDWQRLDRALRSHFSIAPDAEISIEIDPNDLDEERLDAMAATGMTRASLGVQDFNDKVQIAINRIQTFEQTKAVVDGLRARGIASINIDMLYGLPHQTGATIARTAEQALSLNPDRVALFGYAHVPWMKKHQRLIDEAALPDSHQRFAQAQIAGNALIAAGLVPVGMDHFARPGDALAIAAASGTMRRNFQGYTTENADALIGLGASSIGQLPQGIVQNTVVTADYMRAMEQGAFTTVKGYALNDDVRMEAWAIEQIMCNFALSRGDALARFGDAANVLFDMAERYLSTHRDGLFVRNGDRYEVTAQGRPFVRHFAAIFDAFLAQSQARHSVAV